MARHMSDLKRRELALQRAADTLIRDLKYFLGMAAMEKSFGVSIHIDTLNSWNELLANAKRGLQ